MVSNSMEANRAGCFSQPALFVTSELRYERQTGLVPAEPDDERDVRDVRELTLEAVVARLDEQVRDAPAELHTATNVVAPTIVPVGVDGRGRRRVTHQGLANA